MGFVYWQSRTVPQNRKLSPAQGLVDVPDDADIKLVLAAGAPGSQSTKYHIDVLLGLPRNVVASVSVHGPIAKGSIRGLRHVGTSLKMLYLMGTCLNDSDLTIIGQLTSLRHLQTTGNSFSDRGVGELLGLIHLERLDIEEAALGYSGASALAALPSLRSLGLASERITPRQLSELKARFPRVSISDLS